MPSANTCVDFCQATIREFSRLFSNFGVGGVIVPQQGSFAGNPTAISATRVQPVTQQEGLSKILTDVETRLSDPTQKNQITIPISRTIFSEAAYVSALPISAPFDKAIGGIWFLVSERGVDEATKLMTTAAAMIASSMFAQKAADALDTLGGTRWWEITGLETMARTLANRSKEAIACLDVIIWESEKDKQMLKTIASTCNLAADMPLGFGIAGKCALDSKVMSIGDLLDEHSLKTITARGIEHLDIVRTRGWRSAVFVPFDRGGNTVGVLAAYGTRPNGLNNLDARIAMAFANEFCLAYPYVKQANLLAIKERRLAQVAPIVNQVKVSIENIHDVSDHLVGALSSLHDVSKNPSEAKQLAENAATRIRAARGLISGLRSAIQSAKRKPNLPKKVDMGELIKTFEKTVLDQASESDIVFRATPAPGPVICNIDPENFERALGNLFDNSKYFLRGSHRKPKQINLSLNVMDNTAYVVFRDNGPGIEEKDLESIFDYFSSTKGDEGLGLGLAIVQDIVDQNGGRIAVRSKWGEFAEFVITFPTVS